MLQDTNGNPLLHNNSEANGCDTHFTGANINDHATPQTHEQISDKVADETVNGSAYAHRLKSEDKTAYEPAHNTNTPKPGASPPTEHKQHMHLPLRKRHLLATSTGSHHNENLGDSNHSIIPTVHNQDVDTTFTTNTSQFESHQANMTHSKLIEPTTSIHTEPPDPPEPPETLNNTSKLPPTEHSHIDSTKITNGDRNTEHIHEHKDFHENDDIVRGQALAHDLPASTTPQTLPSTLKRNSFPSQHLQYNNNHQPPTHHYSPPHLQSSHPPSRPSSLPTHNNVQAQQKPPPTHSHVSPISTHSPTGTHSPTRAPSPSSQSARQSSNRGRGAGRGRGKASKAEGHSSTNATSSSSGEELYCFCRRPYDPTVDVFMICCDSCDEWYHGSCVGINQREAKKIGRYVCPRCKKMPTSPSTTSANSSEVSSEGEPSTPPSSIKHKKRKGEASFKTEPKRQALSPETVSNNGVDVSAGYDESRYCLNCNKQALHKSKYCGQECGLEYARKQYHNNGSKKPSSATEIADKEALDEIARKKSDIVEKLSKLANEQRNLEKAIQFAKKMDGISAPQPTSPTVPTEPDELASKNHTENTTIDCISCGHPIAVSKYTLHMERCYHKKENNVLMVGATADGGAIYCNAYDTKTKTFCKKLKAVCSSHALRRQNDGPSSDASTATLNGNGMAGVLNSARRTPPQTCGCPTSDFQSGYCELTRKACVKHHNWEDLTRDSILNQRTQHNKILAGLESEEHAVRLRVARRSQASASSYRTIEEA